MPNHHHRSGPLKQSNKKNKRTKSSKRNAGRLAGGKVESRKSSFKQRLVAHTKADRRHIQQQKRDTKRQELIRRKRGIGGNAAPPRVVGIISLGATEETEETLRSVILQQADLVVAVNSVETKPTTVTAKYEKHKKDGNLTILTNCTAFRSQYQSERSDDAAIFSALDLCRVCDLILLVIDVDGEKPENFVGMSIGGNDDDKSFSTNTSTSTTKDLEHLISERGDRVLHAMKSYGLPRVVTILAKTKGESEFEDYDDDDDDDDHMTTQSAKSLRRNNLKRKMNVKKFVSRFATTEFGVDNDKVIEINLKDDIVGTDEPIDRKAHTRRILTDSLIRSLCSISASPPNWVSKLPRSYILSDSHSYDSEIKKLQISGYIRGVAPFDVNSLIHVPNLGTFTCEKLMQTSIPGKRNKSRSKDMICDANEYVVESDPTKIEDLKMFASPDALDGEQNLVGFDEADEDYLETDSADLNNTEKDNGFARPVGWSDYQSAWLGAIDDGENGAEYDDIDHGELANELNMKSSVAADTMEIDDANEVSPEERRALMKERKEQQKDHQEFPDEVQVNDDDKARDRFARYRSLTSFKKSYWDPKENLPDSYASIYHFSSFKSTQRSVMGGMKDLKKVGESSNWKFLNIKNNTEKNYQNADAMEADSDSDDESGFLEGCVPTGSYVTIVLKDVEPKDYNALGSNALLCAATLLPHENKVSVVNMGLQNCMGLSTAAPVKSKDVLTFRCGWRTWTGRPIFSQNNLNCDKHKFERYMPQAGSFFAASVFGPVTYTPCPILVFRNVNGMKELVAFGSMIGADADRIILKRIILTGFPVRVNKRFASVKYMFNDPEDVKWFKPAGLTTKHGLNGKIEQSVGEHGTMKCLFNAPIKQHDTVCLCLYKRVFPKYEEEEINPNEGEGKIGREDILVVK